MNNLLEHRIIKGKEDLISHFNKIDSQLVDNKLFCVYDFEILEFNPKDLTIYIKKLNNNDYIIYLKNDCNLELSIDNFYQAKNKIDEELLNKLYNNFINVKSYDFYIGRFLNKVTLNDFLRKYKQGIDLGMKNIKNIDFILLEYNIFLNDKEILNLLNTINN